MRVLFHKTSSGKRAISVRLRPTFCLRFIFGVWGFFTYQEHNAYGVAGPGLAIIVDREALERP